MTHIIRDMENRSRMVQMHRSACPIPSSVTPNAPMRFAANTFGPIQA